MLSGINWSGIDWLAIGVAAFIGGAVPCVCELVLRFAAVHKRHHTLIHVLVLIPAALVAWTYAWDIADFLRLH